MNGDIFQGWFDDNLAFWIADFLRLEDWIGRSCREESQDFQVEYDSLYFPPQPVQGWRWVQDGVSRTRFRYKMSHLFLLFGGEVIRNMETVFTSLTLS